MAKRLKSGSSPLKQAQYKDHFSVTEAYKRKRKAKREARKKCWANDVEYHKRQVERRQRMEAISKRYKEDAQFRAQMKADKERRKREKERKQREQKTTQI